MHLKFGLMKNFVKATNQGEDAFNYLWEKFPRLSEAKLKEGIFTGPQIGDIIKDEYFDKFLQGDEKAAWDSFKFWGNRRAENYEELVTNLLYSYQKLGCNMSLKIHFLHSPLDFFFFQGIVVKWVMNTENVFIKTLFSMEKRYEGKLNSAMLADNCWTLARDAPNMAYKRQAKWKKLHDFVCVK